MVVSPDPLGAIQPVIVLYVGPDQILPLTSVLGAVVGFALLLGRRVLDVVRSGWSFLRGRSRQSVSLASSSVTTSDTPGRASGR